jgi:hypothetical protein
MKRLPSFAVTVAGPPGTPLAASFTASLWVDDATDPLRWGGTLRPGVPGAELTLPREGDTLTLTFPDGSRGQAILTARAEDPSAPSQIAGVGPLPFIHG